MTITQSEQAPLIIVVGATGNQGGSVLNHLRESDKEYRIRALTRDSTKPKAKEIEATGAQTFQIDLKPENKDKMLEAFSGAHAIFAVTNYWEHMDAAREVAEGKAMVDAAIEAKVGLFIFAGLPGTSRASGGKHTKVYAFDSKAEIDDYGRSKITDTFNYRTVQAAFFYSALQGTDALSFFAKSSADGVFYHEQPVSIEELRSRPIPLIDIPGDFGLWVRAVIEQKEVREDTRPVLCQSDSLLMEDIAKVLSQATGKELKVRPHSPEEYAAGFPAGTPTFLTDCLVDTWQYMFDTGYWGGQDPNWVLPYLARQPTSLADWAKKVDLSYYAK